MTATKITFDEVVEHARKLVNEKPDAVNPVKPTTHDFKQCLYTDEIDPNRHCIAGQILVDLDLPAPDSSVVAPFEEVLAEDNRIGERFSDEAGCFVGMLQMDADNAGKAIPWGEINIDDVIQRYNEYLYEGGDYNPFVD